MGEACLQDRYDATPAWVATMGADCGRESSGWYALKVRTGRELVVSDALTERGLLSYCPTRRQERRYSDRIKVVHSPVFPGYVFCRFDVLKKLPVISTPGVDYIVGFSGQPIPIPTQEFSNIQRMLNAGAAALPGLEAGQRVRVTAGPLRGVEGILVCDGKDHRLVVTIELLNRSASLQVSKHEIAPIAPNIAVSGSYAA